MEALTAEMIKQSSSSTSSSSSPPSTSSSRPSSPSATPSSSSKVDKSAIASFFISVIGSNTEAAEYLYDVLNLVDPLYLKKKRSIDVALDECSATQKNTSVRTLKAAKLEEGEITPEYDYESNFNNEHSNAEIEILGFDVLKDIYFNDDADEAAITLAIQIPNDQGLASIMIGKAGDNITEIRKKARVKTVLEKTQSNSYQKDRAVFFMGKCKQTMIAFQFMLKKMIVTDEEREKRPGISVKDPLVMIIPNEVSSKLIGKGGNTIRTLQANCDAKTSLEKEEQMHAQYSYGRRIFITGTNKQKIHAVYLILRFLAFDCYDDLATSWKGRAPQVLVPPPPTPPPPLPPLPPPPFAGYAPRGYPTDHRVPRGNLHVHSIPHVRSHAQYQEDYSHYPPIGYGPIH